MIKKFEDFINESVADDVRHIKTLPFEDQIEEITMLNHKFSTYYTKKEFKEQLDKLPFLKKVEVIGDNFLVDDGHVKDDYLDKEYDKLSDQEKSKYKDWFKK